MSTTHQNDALDKLEHDLTTALTAEGFTITAPLAKRLAAHLAERGWA